MKSTPSSASKASDLLERIRSLIILLLLAAIAVVLFLVRRDLVGLTGRAGRLSVAVFCIVWILSFALNFLHTDFGKRASRVINIVYTLFVPFFIYLNVEFITAANVREGSLRNRIFGFSHANPKNLLLNILLISLLLAFLVLVTNSVRVGSEALAVFLTLFAIVNLYVNDFRGSGITAADIAVAGTAMDVASAYRPLMYFRVFLGVLNCIFLMVIAGRLRHTRLTSLKKYWRNLLGAALIAAFFVWFIFSSLFTSTLVKRVKYYNMMANAYQTYGTVLTFSRTIFDSFPQKPAGYSPARAQEIADRYVSDEPGANDTVTEASPNVIVIINEAFSDLHALGNFETDQDELSYFYSLTDNCISGVSYASVLGGRTANTEFEVLTGFSLAHLPSTFVIPFQLFINRETPSLASVYAQDNYADPIAIHPYTKENYNRHRAYPLLGFKTYYGEEDLPLKMDTIRRHHTDESVYKNILRLCEDIRETTDHPVFAYCMTIQNHSPFNVEYDNFTSDVHLMGLNREYPDIEQYLSLIKVSDEALHFLISQLEALDEPTVLLFVGDHQPTVSDRFLREVRDEDMTGYAAEMRQYAIPFKIWANFDLEEQTDILTSMNYLQAQLTDFYHAEQTGYQKFLSALHEKIPVLTAMGYVGDDNVFYQLDDTSSPYYGLIQEYAILQYNCLFDSNNRVRNFFEFS